MSYTFLRLLMVPLWLLTYHHHHHYFYARGTDCNVDVCGSVVTKCQLMQSCPCGLNDEYCPKKCMDCLGKSFPFCCSCVELCATEPANESIEKSLVGLFDGMPELFNSFLATESDDDALWTAMQFPAYKSLKKLFPNSSEQIYNRANCTVIYFAACITHKVCAQNCESMGASSYRWFEDGCCECAGVDCLNYGLNESHCTACPLDDIDEEDDEQFEDLKNLEFGENGINDISNHDNGGHVFWDYEADAEYYN